MVFTSSLYQLQANYLEILGYQASQNSYGKWSYIDLWTEDPGMASPALPANPKAQLCQALDEAKLPDIPCISALVAINLVAERVIARESFRRKSTILSSERQSDPELSLIAGSWIYLARPVLQDGTRFSPAGLLITAGQFDRPVNARALFASYA